MRSRDIPMINAMCGASLLVAGVATIGRVAGLRSLTALWSGTPMAASTAAAIVVGCLGAWCSRPDHDGRLPRVVRHTAGWLLVAGCGSLVLAYLLVDHEPGRILDDIMAASGGRMAALTAFAFACLGLGQITLDVRPRATPTPTEWCSFAVFLSCLLASLVHTYGAEGDILAAYTRMAVPTAIALAALAIAMLAARPDGGLVALMRSPAAPGVLARRLLPSVVIVPVAVGWLRLQGESAGLFGREYGVGLMVLLVVVLLTLGTIAAAVALDRVDRARRHAEDERDRFFELAPDPKLMTALDGGLHRMNPAAEAMFGHNADGLAGIRLADLIHADDAPALTHVMTEVAAGRAAKGLRTRCAHRDGSERTLEWSAFPDLERRLIYASARDVTERERLQAELAESLAAQDRAVAALERSNRELREFAQVASHDLQEPLRMVSSYCVMLQEEYGGRLGADADEIIGFAVDGAKRMKALIIDLLSYARLDQGSRFERLDSREPVEEAVRNLSAAIEECDGEIVQGNLPSIVGDRRQLTQLFQNLIGNALKYRGKERPRVAITAQRDADAWTFSVRDNGIGIDPKHHERVFGIFKRLHTREKYPGTGIGLAICKKIVDLHGGRIRVESSVGNGAAFIVTIPDHEEPAPPARNAKP